MASLPACLHATLRVLRPRAVHVSLHAVHEMVAGRSACRAADDCSQFDILVNLRPPDSTSPKKFFEGLIYSSWATLAITG